MKNNGIISYITASLYIKGVKFEPLRRFLQSNTQLIEFKIQGDKVFIQVQMPTATFIASKQIGDWTFNDFRTEGELISKIEKNRKQLSEISLIMRGLEIGRDAVSNIGDYKILTGTNVQKYGYSKISYISNATFNTHKKDEKYFTGERLLIRETGSFLMTLYLDKPIYCNRSLYSIKITDENFKPKYVLACLNSRVLQFYYCEKFKTDTDLFPKIRITQAKQLPIPIATPAQQQPIIALVEKILAAKKQNPQADTTAQEAEIDRLVYELYGLTDEEVKVVEGK